MKKIYKIQDRVGWKWMGRVIEGSVEEVFYEPTVKEIKGKLIKRKGCMDNPAYLVKSKSGNFALKLHSELLDLVQTKLEQRLKF